jgi:hypothetical protein
MGLPIVAIYVNIADRSELRHWTRTAEAVQESQGCRIWCVSIICAG